MPDIPRPANDVLRRNAERECGTLVGQLSIKIRNLPDYQTVSFYCTKPILHADACEFVGNELVVSRRRRAIIVNHP